MNKLNTEEYRLALDGSSNVDILNFNWVDKPHRLVYDLASECDVNQQEIAELKAIVDEFIEEFSCFVAQHECNCGHPSCRTCKECRDAFKVLDNAVKLREGKS